uniref:hypothetical protein n=1 Tax=Bacillus altitudinis TaxID=293387 RepID=UPI00119D36E5
MSYGGGEVEYWSMEGGIMEEGWLLVFVGVVVGLGGRVVVGGGVWCLGNGKGRFRGGVEWESGLKVEIE